MSAGFSGGCLCGAVRYEATGEPQFAGHCQCIDCRKSSGSGHCSHIAMLESEVTVTGETRTFDAPADSGNTVGRAFCPNCGSAIFSVNSGWPGMVMLRASSLDDPEVFKPTVVVYTKRGPSWDTLDPGLTAFEAMPPREGA